MAVYHYNLVLYFLIYSSLFYCLNVLGTTVGLRLNFHKDLKVYALMDSSVVGKGDKPEREIKRLKEKERLKLLLKLFFYLI